MSLTPAWRQSRHISPVSRALAGSLVAVVLLAAVACATEAQQPADADSAAARTPALLPGGRWFEHPLADPLATRMSAALMRTDLLAVQGPERPPFPLNDRTHPEDDVVAAVAIGAVLPLVRLATWREGGLTLFVDGRVFARFRIELPERDDMGQDWLVSAGVDGRSGAWSGRAALTHRSSHLGDEFIARTGAQRIEFGYEQLDLIAAWDVPRLARVYAGGAWVFRSYIDWDERLSRIVDADGSAFQLGADRAWRPWPDRRWAVLAGIDWQAAQRTEWRNAFAAAAGIGVDSHVLAGRSLRALVRFYDGPSTMGQFFLTPERSYSFEIHATL